MIDLHCLHLTRAYLGHTQSECRLWMHSPAAFGPQPKAVDSHTPQKNDCGLRLHHPCRRGGTPRVGMDCGNICPAGKKCSSNWPRLQGLKGGSGGYRKGVGWGRKR